MKHLLKFLILVMCLGAVLVFLSVFSGCSTVQPQPTLHPVLGNHLMLIPEGTRIGSQVAPEEGLYMSKSCAEAILAEERKKYTSK